MTEELQRYPEIESLPREQWATATGDRTLWSSPEWLHSAEDAFSPSRRYVVAPNGGMAAYLVGAETYPNFDPHRLLVGADFMAETAPLRTEREEERIQELAAALPDGVLRPAAVSTVPWGFISGLWTADHSTRMALLDELETLAAQWDAPTAGVLYVDFEDDSLREVLQLRGYIEVLVAANCTLPVGEGGLAEYIAGLSKERRKKTRREIRQFEETGITFGSGTVSDNIDRISHLAASLQAKYGHGYDPDWQAKVLLNVERTVRPYINLAIAERPNGELVGFVVYFVKDGVIYPKMAGFDRSSESHEFVYFNLSFYELIRRAPALGVHDIEYGIDAYSAKVFRGCRLQPRYCYLKPPEKHSALVAELAELVTTGWQRKLGLSDIELPPARVHPPVL
jgi:uncharacterized protein